MTESEFNGLVDDVLLRIEEALDESVTDLDYVTAGGVLTVVCESGAQVIFTRQVAVSQLWVATPDGGFHFIFDEKQKEWLRDSDNQPLSSFLSRVFTEHAQEAFVFEL